MGASLTKCQDKFPDAFGNGETCENGNICLPSNFIDPDTCPPTGVACPAGQTCLNPDLYLAKDDINGLLDAVQGTQAFADACNAQVCSGTACPAGQTCQPPLVCPPGSMKLRINKMDSVCAKFNELKCECAANYRLTKEFFLGWDRDNNYIGGGIFTDSYRAEVGDDILEDVIDTVMTGILNLTCPPKGYSAYCVKVEECDFKKIYYTLYTADRSFVAFDYDGDGKLSECEFMELAESTCDEDKNCEDLQTFYNYFTCKDANGNDRPPMDFQTFIHIAVGYICHTNPGGEKTDPNAALGCETCETVTNVYVFDKCAGAKECANGNCKQTYESNCCKNGEYEDNCDAAPRDLDTESTESTESTTSTTSVISIASVDSAVYSVKSN